MTSSPSFVPSCLRVSELLDQHFDTAFAAPDGIAKLRELILTLAMKGKLVEQDPNDPPASELLKEIEAEKQRLVKAGKIKKPKPLPPIKPEEMPYELPPEWEWVRFGGIAFQITDGAHHTPTYIEEGIPFLSVKDMSSGSLDFSDSRFISSEQHQELIKRCYPQMGDLLVTKVGTTGIPVLVDVDCEFSIFVSVALIKFPQHLLSGEFLTWLIKAPLVKKQSEDGTEGVGNKNLVLRKIANFLLALPPLPEQHRIVARIDQLMARCDALEKLRKERETQRLAVHAAAIKQLLDAPDGSAWDFIQQNFGELYTVKENVAELRKAILQLAVMGRLVPQDPNDPPASELLREIEAEKQRLVKPGKIKKPKPLPPIKPEEVPYDLPLGWEWVRLGEIAGFENGDRSKRYPNDNDLQASGIPFFGAKDMVEGVLRFDNGLRFISEAKFKGLSNGKLRNNDFVMLLRGTVGKIASFLQTDKYATGFINAQMLIIRLFNSKLCHYFRQYSATKFFQELVVQKTTGSAVRQMPSNVVAEFLVPLPPLPEQHRIVARIDQLMALCDTLDQQIDAATGKQIELLNAVMAAV